MGTYGRDEVLRCFLESLRKQTHRDFKFIIVDQNTDYRIKQICNDYSSDFKILYLRADKPGLSLARNIGIKYVSEDIVAFPDDDCEYPPDLLANVNTFFEKNHKYNILTVAQSDTKTKKKVSWFLPKPCNIRETNILRAGTSISIFIKIKNNLLNFDEQFGVGAPLGSAEEKDYLFRLLQLGYKGYYDPGLEVHHQERNFNNISLNTIHNYEIGLGAYLKKHMFFGQHWNLLGICFTLLLVRPIGGMLFSLAKLNLLQFTQYKTRFKGRIKGFITYNRNSYAISKTFNSPCPIIRNRQ